MSTARDVNVLLDRLSQSIEQKNKSEIIEINNELNKVTRNGTNCRGLFDNIYYVNNYMMDKECKPPQVESEEEVAQKIIKEMQNGKEEHRTS